MMGMRVGGEGAEVVMEGRRLAAVGVAVGDGVGGLVALFEERAGALGVTVGRVGDAVGAAGWLAELARAWRVTEAVVSGEVWEGAGDAPRLLGGQGLTLTDAGEPGATRDAPLGVSLARLAVAETGSVLLAEPSLADRAIGMLAASQVVICATGRLVGSLDEAAPVLRALAGEPGGSYATLVTGPSRTADIERVLTVGVQGPGRVAVLFVDELG